MGRGVKLGEFSRQAVERASPARYWDATLYLALHKRLLP
jgi:hypothetical protein